MIDNPKYKGEWKPKQIPNPKFYEDKTPLAHIGKIGAVGVEVWTMSKGLVLDNIVADEDVAAVKAFGKDAFEAKAKAVNSAVEAREEEARAKAEAEASRESVAPIGLRFFESLADKIPGPIGVFAQDAMAHFATNALHYYLTFFTLPTVLIILLIAARSLRSTDEQKSKKAQQAKDAKKKKDDDVKEDDDAKEGDENEPPVEEEKKTPSKRRVRRIS
jgi:calnexin